MRIYQTPGVYRERLDAASGGVIALRMDVTALVGIAERGPLHLAVPVESQRQFTAWFGPLRDKDDAGHLVPVFKSWASPNLEPASCANTFFSHTHRILLPTTTFMNARAKVLAHQGRDGVWFAGGWTNWFDSQEAALDSATDVTDRIAGTSPGNAIGIRRRSDDPARQHQRLVQWVTGIAAHAPVEHRKALLNLVNRVQTEG